MPRIRTEKKYVKSCPDCGQSKAVSEFHKNSAHPSGLASYCKSCVSSRARKRYQSPGYAEKVAQQRKAKGRTGRITRVEQKFGLKPGDWDAMYNHQGGQCAICGDPDMKSHQGELPCVDHCHDTGQVRGLLCGPCNTLLGMAKDKVETLRAAISYLEDRPTIELIDA